MEKFFYIIGTTLLFAWLLLSGSAHADSSTAACKQGCGNAHAPGAGTGKSACFVTFVAPTGATALKAQVFDVSGQGLLRNAQKQVAIRGGEPDTSRVSADCRVVLTGDYIVLCLKFEGKDKTMRLEGPAFKALVPRKQHTGQVVYNMPPVQ